MAEYGISFNFHPICMIQLVNEKYPVGLSLENIYKYLALFVYQSKNSKRLSKPVSTQLSLLNLWKGM